MELDNPNPHNQVASTQSTKLSDVATERQRMAKAARVHRLITGFPGQQLNTEQLDPVLEAFEIALAEFNADDVATAATWWMQGKNGEGNENYSFAPSAPQLAILARKAAKGFAEAPSRYETLNAPEAPPPPTEDEKNRVQELVATLKANKVHPARQPSQQIPIPEQKVLDEMKDRAAALRQARYQAAQADLEREAVKSLMDREGRKGN